MTIDKSITWIEVESIQNSPDRSGIAKERLGSFALACYKNG